MMSQPKESGSDGENRPYKDFDDGMLRGEIARLRSMVLVVGSREESALRGLREEYAVRMAEGLRKLPRAGVLDSSLVADDILIAGKAPQGGDDPMMAFRDKVIAVLQGQMGLSGNAGKLGASVFDGSTDVGPRSIMLDPRMPLGGDGASGIDSAPSEMDGPSLTPPPIPPHAR